MTTWRAQLIVLVVAIWVATVLVWRSAPQFEAVTELRPHCDGTAAEYPVDTPLKVLSLNAQYMAGKGYVFFYDVDGGPDVRPSQASVALTVSKVADLLKREQPDVVMLQEINDADDSRTHYLDQVEALQRALGDQRYACEVSAHYWKVGWLPHPLILGSVSMQLTTLSRYRLTSATRFQLPLMDNDPITQHFYFQRALLQVTMDSTVGEMALLNTHLDAWGQGTDLMKRQVDAISNQLTTLDEQNIPWVLAGDFNVLPPDGGRQWQRLAKDYDQRSALQVLYDRYGALPPLPQLTSASSAEWYTYFPNDPQVTEPDRTIDYVFYSDHWRLLEGAVIPDTSLSDHLPLKARFIWDR